MLLLGVRMLRNGSGMLRGSSGMLRGDLPAPARAGSEPQLLPGDPVAGWVAMARPFASS